MLMYQKENIKKQFPKLYRNNLILSAFSLIQQKESELLKMMANKPEIIKYKGFNMAAKLDQCQTSPLSLSIYNVTNILWMENGAKKTYFLRHSIFEDA